jgi:DNA-binding PadR family transcriptional regulator
MGNTIVPVGDGGDEATSRWMKAAGIAIDEEHYRKVTNAKDMDLMAGVEIKGDEAMIQALAEFSKRNASHVKGILNLTIPLSESPMWILGQYLSQLGLSTESRRPMEDGQRVRYYRLNTEDVELIQKVLEYRQRQREERERKPQASVECR